ncbi:MAG: NapC/NirT family cytochrome c [Deltaproteobacteria bacterium]|jgi:cytochrome c nitrite reductase small subunit|nr:NapC/NirT family cytochrome c [Deltaproteobacteria bacterium]
MTKNRSPGGKRFYLLVAFIVGFAAFWTGSMTMGATDEASFCASCHVMSESVWTNKLGVHAKQACNECHMPGGDLTAYLTLKATRGLRDVAINTFMDVPDNIEAAKDMKDVIQANCVRCHYETVRQVNMTVKTYCTDCHRAVPHLNKMPIDRRKAADV